jgi:hypothetical protein
MKKKIFGGIAIIVIIAFATFHINLNTQNENFSLLSLANIEALAEESGSESGGGYSCTVTYNCTNGSISCTGTRCSRGTTEKYGIPYVKCDGQITYC